MRSMSTTALKPFGLSSAAGAGKFTYGMTNPVSSNSGFSALVGVAAALSGTGAPLDQQTIDKVAPQLRGFFSAQRVTSGSSGWLSDTYAADPGRADGLINYESVLLTLNASHKLPEPLTLVYPADGVVTADYPLTRLASASDLEPIVRAGVNRFVGARLKARLAAADLSVARELLRPLFCDETVNFVSEVHGSGELRTSALEADGRAITRAAIEMSSASVAIGRASNSMPLLYSGRRRRAR